MRKLGIKMRFQFLCTMILAFHSGVFFKTYFKTKKSRFPAPTGKRVEIPSRDKP